MATHPEQALISSVIRTSSHMPVIAEGVTSDLFHTYQEEMKWLERYITKNKRTPSKTAFKSQFPDFVFKNTDEVEHWSGEVKKEHLKHVLLERIESSMDLIEEGDSEKAVKTLRSGLVQVTSQMQGQSEDFDIFTDWNDVYGDVSSRVERVKRYGNAGIPTGFPTLDNITGGFQPGWMTVVAARLGQGKTWTLIRMAWAAVVAGYTVSYFSLEQSRNQIAMRAQAFASSKYGKDVYSSLDLMKGKGFDLLKYKKFLGELEDQVAGQFFVNDMTRGKVSPMTIAATIEDKQPDIVFIDYLTLLERVGDDWQSVARISAEVKAMAERYQVPVVVASQINRAGGMTGKEPPGAEHLSQADAIGQDSDLILTMVQRTPRVMRMKVAKFRHGPDGIKWFCRFSPGTGQFKEVSGDEAEEIMEEDQEVD